MTKRTKLLSLIICAIACFFMAFTLIFANSASAEVAIPNPPANKIASISPKTLSTAARYKTITTATATDSDWIIFEWTNGDNNVLTYTGGWGSMIGITKNKMDLVYADTNLEYNATHLFVTMCSGANVGKTVKLYFSTTTGDVYASYDGSAATLVATIPDANRTYQDTDSVYASLRFNEFPSINLELINMKAYDAEGNNLGLESSFIFSAPTVDSSNLAGQAIVTTNKSRAVIKTTELVDAEWVFFEWTNGDNDVRNVNLSGGESLNFVAGKTAEEILYIHENGATVINNTIYSPSNGYADILATGATVKVAFPMEDKASPVVYIKPQGQSNFIKQNTAYAINEFATQSGNLNDEYMVGVWMNGLTNTNDGFTAFDLKCYDEKGNAVEFDTYNFAKYVTAPIVDSSDRAGATGVATGTSRTMIRTQDQVTSDWVIFEWKNSVSNKNKEESLSGGAGMWLLAAPTVNAMVDPHKYSTIIDNVVYSAENGYSDILGAGNHVKIAFSMKDAANPMIFIKKPSDPDFVKHNTSYYLLAGSFADDGGDLNGGTHYVGIWMNALFTAVEDFAFTDLKCYDENGTTINVAYNLIDVETTTITFKDGASEFKKYENAVPGNNFEQFNVGTPNSANFIGWTKTENGVDFISTKDAVPSTATTYFAKYADSTVADLSVYAGVYKGAKSYFELTETGRIESHFSVLESGEYKVLTASGTNYFSSNGTVATVGVNTLTIDGEIYAKTNDYKTVTYSYDGSEIAKIKVPTGMAAVSSIPFEKTAFTFNGWFNGENKYNFAKPITEDLNLVANLTLNQSPETSYGAYNFSYYNKSTDTLYIIDTDGYVKVVSGVKTEGQYLIAYDSKDNSIEYLILDGNVDAPLKVTAGEISGDNDYYRLQEKYYITLVNGDGTETVITVTAETLYRAVLPEDPSIEGYTFKGWKLSDGTTFDENAIITSAITLYADLESAVEEGSVPTGGGIGALAIVAIIIASVVLLGAVVAFVLYKKGILFVKK